MFIECRKKYISVPASTETNIIFPFHQLRFHYRLNRKQNQNISSDLSIEDAQSILKEVQSACRNFKSLRTVRNLFFISLLLTFIAVLLGAGLIGASVYGKKGDTLWNALRIWDSDNNSTQHLRASTAFFISGICITSITLILFAVLLVLLIKRCRSLRIEYEQTIFALFKKYNDDLKNQGIRWKIGLQLRWVEVSLDYKKRTASSVLQKEKPAAEPQDLSANAAECHDPASVLIENVSA